MQVDSKARPDPEREFTRDHLFALDPADGLPAVSSYVDESVANQASFDHLQQVLHTARKLLEPDDAAQAAAVKQQQPPSKSAGKGPWREFLHGLIGKPRKQYVELSKDAKRSKEAQAEAVLGDVANLMACAIQALGKQSKEQRKALAAFCIEHCLDDMAELAGTVAKQLQQRSAEQAAEQKHSKSMRGSPAGKKRALAERPVNLQASSVYKSTAMTFNDLPKETVRKIVHNMLRWHHKRHVSQRSFQMLRNVATENAVLANVPNIMPTKQHLSEETAAVRKANHATRQDLILLPELKCDPLIAWCLSSACACTERSLWQ